MIDINLEILRYQRLSSLGRDLEGFVHNAAGPLNIVLGYLQVLRSKYPQEAGFEKMWNAGLELDRELKDLGSHLEAAETEILQDIDINAMILRQLELLRANNYFKHNIESVAELSEKLPQVRAIYGDIVICLDVILNNAIAAVRESDIKKIVVRSDLEHTEKGDMLKITVRDTGEGIEESKLDKYFELGYSGWHSHEPKGGLGLALAEYIMGKIGGKLGLENSCGCGAEASLLIPLRAINGI